MGNPTNHKNHTNHSSDNPLRAPVSVLRGQSPSFQPPSRPYRPRHQSVIPAKAGIQRGGDVGNPTNHKNHTNHSSDNPLPAPSRPSWTIPVIPTAHPSQSRGAGTWGIPLIKNHKNHSSDNSLRAPSCPSWIIPVIPTAHPSFRRRPESRGAGTWGIPLITKITRITVQTTPFAPLVSFVDNPRHSNRPPVIPAAAGIQRGGDVGNPTNHKNHTNHSSDNPLRALSVLRGQSPSFQPPTRHSGGGRNPEGRGRGESH